MSPRCATDSSPDESSPSLTHFASWATGGMDEVMVLNEGGSLRPQTFVSLAVFPRRSASEKSRTHG